MVRTPDPLRHVRTRLAGHCVPPYPAPVSPAEYDLIAARIKADYDRAMAILADNLAVEQQIAALTSQGRMETIGVARSARA